MQFSVKTWNRIFAGFQNLEDVTEESFDALCKQSSFEPQVPFTAMKKRRADSEASPDLERLNVEDNLPADNIKGKFSSFTDDQAFKEAWKQLLQCVSTLQSDLPLLKSRLKRTKLDLEIAVDGVESSVELLSTDIGQDPGIDQGAPVTSVWSGIQLAINSAKEAHSLLQHQQSVLDKASERSKLHERETFSS